jgi:hypothetical protein
MSCNADKVLQDAIHCQLQIRPRDIQQFTERRVDLREGVIWHAFKWTPG